ncbi:retron St85 family RNA-directed DNA polymerase [Azorhizophilus paspali]|uniref:RNA-directed DNA polymerase n=1 Tax=Azorhizophilus paspali TaxID=69963 RepID=A0ABV6SL81_AZOPA
MRYKEILSEISSSLALSAMELIQIAAKSPYTYKVYSIDKKTGGERTIAQPARETKFLQRELIGKLFNELPVHEAATAYRDGSSIKKNAWAHKDNRYLSKFDFKNFFESITEGDLELHFKKHFGEQEFSTNFIRFISRVSCYYNPPQGLTLSIGAPTSPLLSNSVMYEFDCLIFDWCNERGLTYTRYADDLTFSSSTKGQAFEIEGFIEGVLAKIEYPRLSINNKKTLHVSMSGKRRVTGLIISNDGKVSLGRDRKRLISAMIHRYATGSLTGDELSRLQGLLGFAEDVEPLFCSKMRAKYGIKVISEIFQFRKLKNN